MQSLSDDERKAVLGEVLADEIHTIYEYIKGVRHMKQIVNTELKQLNSKLSQA